MSDGGPTRYLRVPQVAAALEVPERTARLWLANWLALGVPGIRKVPARGSRGFRYAVEPWIPEAWRSCQLPAPRLT
jgi:hypothetical protein